MELTSTYNPTLVSFSIFIAVIAAYTALELTERISVRGKIKVGWLIGSSVMMGTGVWSMHFVGMLAYSIGIPVGYDLTTVIISWIPAVIASGIVFYYLKQGFSNLFDLVRAGTLMGSGIGAMHYIGMAAMRVPANMHYDYSVVALSVVFAVILSSVSLATANFVVKGFLEREEIKIAGSFLMGTAISGMHYIAMVAVGFTPSPSTPNAYIGIENTGLASTIGIVTIIMIFGALMASMRAQKVDLQIMTKKLKKSSKILKSVNQELENRVSARTSELREAKDAAEKRNTELKQAQREAIAKNAQLKQAQAVVLSKNSQLQQAKEVAENASKSKDMFLANISHELRTPLNSILGYVKIMQRDTNLYPSQIQDLQIVQQSGTHLLTLINDILDLSKTNAGKMELNPTSVDLHSVLDEVIGITKMWAREKNLGLQLETDDRLPTQIRTDKKRLRQVLINLLSNAVKFTASGQVTLRVKVLDDVYRSPQVVSQQKLRFEIRDTGIGMSSEQLEKIFLPFEQVGDIESQNQGTGLGLSVSKELVELMGGKLEVESKLGAGTTFWFEPIFEVLNVERRVETPTQSQLQQIDTGKIKGYQGRPRKLLIVDDKKENRDLLVKILQPIGFDIEKATNGQQMLEMAAFIKPDLILLDLFMPVKTGFISLRELRQKPEFKSIPIIVVTASSITKEMSNYLDCEAVLHKPIEEEELLLNLEKFLELEWVYKDKAS